MIQIDLGGILRYFQFGPVAHFREAISQMGGSQTTRIKMVYASLSAPEAPSHSGAVLNTKESWLIEMLELDAPRWLSGDAQLPTPIYIK